MVATGVTKQGMEVAWALSLLVKGMRNGQISDVF